MHIQQIHIHLIYIKIYISNICVFYVYTFVIYMWCIKNYVKHQHCLSGVLSFRLLLFLKEGIKRGQFDMQSKSKHGKI